MAKKIVDKTEKKYEYEYKNVYIAKDIYKKVRLYAAEKDCTLKDATAELIMKGLANV